MTDEEPVYDVVVVGAGIAGAIVAKEMGAKGYSVLLLEAGDEIPNGREAHMEKFFLDTRKFPESPYRMNKFAPAATVADLVQERPFDSKNTYLDQSSVSERRALPDGKYAEPFKSTYERLAGGTMWHWMGTSLRFIPRDFDLPKHYGLGVKWPITYSELAIEGRRDGMSYYDLAEHEIGVAANVSDQSLGSEELVTDEDPLLYRSAYQYPMPGIPISQVDRFFKQGVGGDSNRTAMHFEGRKVWHYSTPAGRNSRPYKNRRACAGNTNCVPICPIQAKYDPTVTLHAAFNYPRVTAQFHAVATRLHIKPDKNEIDRVEYIEYDASGKLEPRVRMASGIIVVLAAHGIETAKLLLLSAEGEGNPHFKNKQIGRNLMDHPFYIRHGLTPTPVFPYRGPLSTGGLDGLRDGEFRNQRAAFRIEIGNEGWRLPQGDPDTTVLQLVKNNVFGADLVRQLNHIFTRQVRIGFELEQLPDPQNRVTLSQHRDALGLRRPKIDYSISDYEVAGFVAAHRLTKQLFDRLQIEDRSAEKGLSDDELMRHSFDFLGAGHIMGTCRMGACPDDSVVNKFQQSHDYPNLFIVGSSVFPTGGTANPTLTLAALTMWAADSMDKLLKDGIRPLVRAC